MYNEVIYLIKEVESIDVYGDLTKTEVSKCLFAKLASIGANEFYNAQASGLKPEIKFVIADYLDYAYETKLKYTTYNGTQEEYKIIRTYRNGNSLELTCQKVGD